MKDVNSLVCIETSLFMQVRKVLSAAKDGVEESMHHQSKERNMSKSQQKNKNKKNKKQNFFLTRSD